MEPSSPLTSESGPSPAERALAFFEVLTVALLGQVLAAATLPLLGWEPALILERSEVLLTGLFLDGFFTLLLIGILLGLHGHKWKSLNPLRRNWRREITLGFLILPLLMATVIATSLFMQHFFPQWTSEVNPILELIRSPWDVAGFMAAAILVGGIKEEIQRAFILRRFDSHLGGSVLGLIVWSSLFGFMHIPQGVDRAIQAGLLGLVLGILYLRRGHLGAPIVSHSAYDVVIILLVWHLGSEIS